MKELVKSKTFWTGIAGLVSAAGAYLTGSMDAGQAIQLAITSLAAIFLRDGMRPDRNLK